MVRTLKTWPRGLETLSEPGFQADSEFTCLCYSAFFKLNIIFKAVKLQNLYFWITACSVQYLYCSSHKVLLWYHNYSQKRTDGDDIRDIHILREPASPVCRWLTAADNALFSLPSQGSSGIVRHHLSSPKSIRETYNWLLSSKNILIGR